MADFRKNFNWKEQINISLDPEKAGNYRESLMSKDEEVCSMCGEFCAIKKVKEYFSGK